MTTGSIVRIVHGREFGFIEPSNNTEDVFFDFKSVDKNCILDELKEGLEVEYELVLDVMQANRTRAENVRLS
ncbi:MAG: cold shock domain-containing protein [Chloroflexi bacterium]|nr:cold shock domain-containing protein [Chloroflexota bacterium]